MSEHLNLGKIITNEQERDAIHIAVAPMLAAEKLLPGEHVSVIGSEAWGSEGQPIGVVDPYLKGPVKKGQRFWLFLYPGSITSLRHEWIHPALNGPQEPTHISQDDHAAKSRAWISEHANYLGITDDVLMADAEHWLEYQEHRIQHDSERWRNNFNPEEFWHHYEIVTGKPVEKDKKSSFYCCTC